MSKSGPWGYSPRASCFSQLRASSSSSNTSVVRLKIRATRTLPSASSAEIFLPLAWQDFPALRGSFNSHRSRSVLRPSFLEITPITDGDRPARNCTMIPLSLLSIKASDVSFEELQGMPDNSASTPLSFLNFGVSSTGRSFTDACIMSDFPRIAN